MSHDSHVTRGQMEDISEIIQIIILPGRHDQRRHGKLPRGQPAVLDADPGGQGALVLGGQRHRQDRADHDHGHGDQGEGDTGHWRWSRWPPPVTITTVCVPHF